MPAPVNPQLEMVALDAFPVQEPLSRRAYTCLRLRTRLGAVGYGECFTTLAGGPGLRGAIQGKEASSFESIRRGLDGFTGGVGRARYGDARPCRQVHQRSGLPGAERADSDHGVAVAVAQARAAGHRAFLIPVPATHSPNHSATLVNATRQRLDRVRSAAGEGSDFVLDAAGKLTPGDASSLAAAVERLHLLWLDEPCPLSNLSAAYRIATENVTPVGFGRFAAEAGIFKNLLRSDAIDVVRPDLARHGITQSRRISAVAEPYYVAVAPFHDGGPIATAAALNLAASLPNFFIQQVPYPAAEEDRRMRARLAGESIETVKDGFLQLPRGPGLGIRVNEAAFTEYREREL